MLETTLAGSMPKPAWLAEPRKLWPAWRLEGEALADGKRDAVLACVKRQEDAGIDIVCDGEQTRDHFVHGFLVGIEGVDFARKRNIGIRADRYRADAPTVTGAIGRSRPVHGEELRFLRAHSRKPVKFTLPGPMTIVDTLADDHYRNREKLAFAFAAALNAEVLDLEAGGANVIQFDEPAFNVYPEEVRDWGIAALERAARGLKIKTAVHICYGYGIPANIAWKNALGAQWRQYEDVFPLLANSAIGQVSLECANSRVPIELLGLLKGKDVLVGAIDVASATAETPEQVAAVIRSALKHVPAEHLYPCTNCGMAPMDAGLAWQKVDALAQGAAIVRREIGAR
jgi:5-methyltetrahydropteroyltriglutamate--homocysteine methyltransferase